MVLLLCIKLGNCESDFGFGKLALDVVDHSRCVLVNSTQLEYVSWFELDLRSDVQIWSSTEQGTGQKNRLKKIVDSVHL